MFENDLFMDLPEDIKRRIVTQYLTGGSLRTVLRVSKTWNSYFKAATWDEPTVGKYMRLTLENNWRSGVFREKEEYWHLDEDCQIGAISPNYLSIISPEDSPLETVKISIFRLSTGEVWNIPEVFDTVFLTAMKNKFEMVMTDKIVAIRLDLKEVRGQPRSQQLLVWRMNGGKKIVDQKIESLRTFLVSCNEKDEEILILQTDYLEVWNFNVENQISKVQSTRLCYSPFSIPYYNSPFILQSSTDELSDIRTIQVWRYSDAPLILQTHIEIQNLEIFVHENGVRQAFQIDEMIYFGGFFIVSCRCPLKAGTEDIICLSLKVISDDGNVLRECFLPQFPFDVDVVFYPFYGRLVVVVDTDVYIFQDDMSQLPNAYQSGQLALKKMEALDGANELFFRHTTGNSAQIIKIQNMFLLNIQTLDFWEDLVFKLET